jgi:hypothetical protein
MIHPLLAAIAAHANYFIFQSTFVKGTSTITATDREAVGSYGNRTFLETPRGPKIHGQNPELGFLLAAQITPGPAS